MKKSIFFFIIILFSCSLFSNTVKISKAKQISISWMSERTGSDYGLSDIGEVIVNSEGKDTLYYVINFINGGWVLVAADERVYPVIGYSLKNQYTLNNIPPAHEEWMDKVMRSVKKLKMLNAKANEFIVNAWDYYGDENFRPSLFKSGVPVIGPLVQTTWDQDYPYNKFCPVDSSASDNHAKTGCVAVAMAQVMKYYNHPSSGMDSISYTPSSHPEYGVQKIVFSGQSYNWTSMSEDDIAKLIYHCGVGAEMDYGPDVSISNNTKAMNALADYFKYDFSSMYYAKKDLHGYSDSAWKELIKSTLNDSCPLLYRGTGGSGGHVFVCDGYDDEDYFHFNWGWGGNHDGYYRLDSLTPGGTDFNNEQKAVIGIKPATQFLPDLIPYAFTDWSDSLIITTKTGTTTDESLFTSEDTIYVDYAYYNNGNKDAGNTFYTRLLLDGTVVRNVSLTGLDRGLYSYRFDYELGKLAPGVHTITLSVDALDDVVELDENNNIEEKVIVVDCPSTPFPLKAEKPSGDTLICENPTNTQYFTSKVDGADSYVWQMIPDTAGVISGNDTLVTVDWNDNHIGLTAIVVAAQNSCGTGESSDTLFVLVDNCSSVMAVKEQEGIQVMPNPTIGKIEIKGLDFPCLVELYSITGIRMDQFMLNDENKTVNLKNYPEGIYFLKAKEEIIKIIKE